MTRRNLYLPDALYQRILLAVADESVRRGRTMSVSEWVREAAHEKIADGPGVYIVEERATGRVYVGASRNVQRRWHVLKSERFSPDAFDYRLLEPVRNGASLQEREQYWMDHYRERLGADMMFNRYTRSPPRMDREPKRRKGPDPDRIGA